MYMYIHRACNPTLYPLVCPTLDIPNAYTTFLFILNALLVVMYIPIYTSYVCNSYKICSSMHNPYPHSAYQHLNPPFQCIHA